jgi:hypothetical protein
MKKLTWEKEAEDGVTDSTAWPLHGTLLSAVLRQKTRFDGAETLWAPFTQPDCRKWRVMKVFET